jgi:dihydrofolate reductase
MSVILTVGPVARSLNGVIGRDNGLPWRLKSDLAIFKARTLGKPVILPRKPLPGRMNIVLSLDGSFEPPQAVVCESFLEALQMAKEQAADDGVDEVCVIGGRAVFEMALPRARRLYLTEVQADVEGDVSFPEFDETAWTEVSREEHPAGPDDDHAFVFRVLERR